MGFRLTRKRRGGAFQAKGSYGCVFRKPPLKCRNEATRRNNSFISKISNSSVADEEYGQSMLIQHFDPDMRYFVTADKECEFDNANIKPENNFDKCTLNDIESAKRRGNYSNVRLVLYKNAGIDLHRVQLTVEDYIPFFESLVNIFNALKFIHSKGIIHHDLKRDNLITQKNPDGTFTSRLIDVGFICAFKDVPGSPEIANLQKLFMNACLFSHFQKKARSYGPFYEFLFAVPNRGQKPHLQEYIEGKDFTTIYTNWVEDVSKYLGSEDPFKKEDGTPAFKYSDVMDALVETWGDKADKSFHVPEVSADFVLDLASKADIFSLGMVLVKLHRDFLHHTVERKGGDLKVFVPRSTKLKNAGAPEIWVDVEDLSRFGVPAEQADWHKAVARRISLPLFTLMTKMSKLDPRRALDINEALREYTELLEPMRELYTPSKLYKGLTAIGVDGINAPVKSASKASPKSSPKPAAKASSPTPPPPPPPPKLAAATSTRKLRLDEKQKKALAKKKKALEKAKKEEALEIQALYDQIKEYRKKRREIDDNLDKAKRDKMDPKVIREFEKALAKYDALVQQNEEEIAEKEEELRGAQANYNSYRAALPRL